MNFHEFSIGFHQQNDDFPWIYPGDLSINMNFPIGFLQEIDDFPWIDDVI